MIFRYKLYTKLPQNSCRIAMKINFPACLTINAFLCTCSCRITCILVCLGCAAYVPTRVELHGSMNNDSVLSYIRQRSFLTPFSSSSLVIATTSQHFPLSHIYALFGLCTELYWRTVFWRVPNGSLSSSLLTICTIGCLPDRTNLFNLWR